MTGRKKRKKAKKISKTIAKVASEYVIRFEEKQIEIVRHIKAAVEEGGLTYLEAMIEYARDYGIEIEALAEVINANEPLKQALKEEAADLRLIKAANTAKLPQI